MPALLRLVAFSLAAFQLAAAWVPCPALAEASPAAPQLERFCPCGCTAGPAAEPTRGAAAGLPGVPRTPARPALDGDAPQPAARLPAAPARPVDHVPLPA